MPGGAEISELVRNLEEEYNDAAWNIRTRFPPAGTGRRVVKVDVGPKLTERRKTSLLSKEVKPDDINSDSGKSSTSNDGTSSHPPLTYDHPLDGHELPSWLEEALQQDGEADQAEFDFGSSGWCISHNFDADEPANDHNSEDVELREQINEVIKAFWEVVDNDGIQQAQQSSTTTQSSLESRLGALNVRDRDSISDSASETPSESDPYTEGYDWSDGSCDSTGNLSPSQLRYGLMLIKHDFETSKEYTPFSEALGRSAVSSTPSIITPRPPTKKYDKMRAELAKNLHIVNPDRFYAKWLELSRLEIREKESVRPDPRLIPAPPFIIRVP